MIRTNLLRRSVLPVLLTMLLVLSGCRSDDAAVSSGGVEDGSVVSSTTDHTPSSTTTGTSNGAGHLSSVTTTGTSGGADSATPSSKKPSTTAPQTGTVVSALRMDWDSVSAEAKKVLSDGGVRRSDLIVDKSKLTYDKEASSSKYHPQYARYRDGENWYSFNDLEGKLTYVSLKNNTNESTTISEERAKYIGATIADLIIDVDQYAFYDYVHDYEHIIVYRRMVGEYCTHEGVIITVREDGSVSSIGIYKVGLLEGVKAPTVDEKWLNEQCAKVLKDRFENYQSHTMTDKKLDIKDGQLMAYYQYQPEIEYGQMVIICMCVPTFSNGMKGRGEVVVVPIA